MTELHAIRAYYSAEDGQMVTLDDDVLGIVRQVRDLYGQKIKICWEPTTEHYVFSELCRDGAERLIFTSEHLDQRDLDRLIRADSTSRGYEDTYDRNEREQDELHAQRDEALIEQIHEAGEELAWSLGDGKFGPGYKQSILIPKDVCGPDATAT